MVATGTPIFSCFLTSNTILNGCFRYLKPIISGFTDLLISDCGNFCIATFSNPSLSVKITSALVFNSIPINPVSRTVLTVRILLKGIARPASVLDVSVVIVIFTFPF